jgi:hypothetical protein
MVTGQRGRRDRACLGGETFFQALAFDDVNSSFTTVMMIIIQYFYLLILKQYHLQWKIPVLKWRKILHTSICWRHFTSSLKHSLHLLSINHELLFRFSICFHFFLFFHQNPRKTRLISICYKYQGS